MGDKMAGRPTKYNKELHPKLAELCARIGMIDTEIAEYMGIAERTLNNWKKQYPEFMQSIKSGKESIDDQVENSLLKKALGYYDEDNVELFHYQGEVIEHPIKKYFPADTASIIFWLKNRRKEKWRDKQDHEISFNQIVVKRKKSGEDT